MIVAVTDACIFIDLIELDIVGYFGLTMPVISVKPCYFERSYKEGKFLFIFQYSLS